MRRNLFKKLMCSISICSLIVTTSCYTNLNTEYQVFADTEDVLIQEIESEGIPEDFSNQFTNFVPSVMGETDTTFLQKLSDGGYRIAVYADKLIINDYDSDFQLKDSKELELELPIWGGIYLGQDYNYVVCGQKRQSDKEKGGETYRIIKYDADFNRIASLSLNSSETYTAVPFLGGNVSIDVYQNFMTVYTSRLRLDGHQSNIAIRIYTDSMTLQNQYGMISAPDIHTSHSFRQIVRYDGKNPVYVDLTDGYPVRSVYIQSVYGKKSLKDIEGDIGDNVTNAEVSGLEISDTHYLVTGSYQRNGMNNIFLSCMDKQMGETQFQWLTNATVFQSYGVANPEIVKISDDQYVIMWQKAKYGTVLEYVIADSCGEIISGVKQISSGNLTDCKPIVDHGSILWVSADQGRISVIKLSGLKLEGTFDSSAQVIPVENPWDGTVDTGWYSDDKTDFEIDTPQKLAGLSQLVNEGKTFGGKNIHLIKDIFLNGDYYEYEWTPIAYCDSQKDNKRCFEGTFDGQSHSIYNMYISEKGKGGGLFGSIGSNGVVKAVNIEQGYLNRGGCIASYSEGKIAFCNSYSLVGSTNERGSGICNYNAGLIYGCRNYGCVWGDWIGGIVGCNDGIISECSNYGSVESSFGASGIAALNFRTICNCYNVGILSNSVDGLNAGAYLAGISESNKGYIYNCYFAGVFSFIENGTYNHFCAISCDNENMKNCYALSYEKYCDSPVLVQMNDFLSAGFIDRLNQNIYDFGFPAWRRDTLNINEGYPVTQAEINYERGVCKIIPGDVNGDGLINIRDSALVRRAAAGWEVEIDRINADVNGDGKISIIDSAMIRRYAGGWEVEFN